MVITVGVADVEVGPEGVQERLDRFLGSTLITDRLKKIKYTCLLRVIREFIRKKVASSTLKKLSRIDV